MVTKSFWLYCSLFTRAPTVPLFPRELAPCPLLCLNVPGATLWFLNLVVWDPCFVHLENHMVHLLLSTDPRPLPLCFPFSMLIQPPQPFGHAPCPLPWLASPTLSAPIGPFITPVSGASPLRIALGAGLDSANADWGHYWSGRVWICIWSVPSSHQNPPLIIWKSMWSDNF